MPKVVIARAPIEPTMASNWGAIASSARPTRSSFKVSAVMPNTSGTAQVRAQSSTRTSGVGEVSRLATSVSITCPCVAIATSRTGQSRSIVAAIPSLLQKAATTGSEPSALSTLGGPKSHRCLLLATAGFSRVPGRTPASWQTFFRSTQPY